MAGVGEVAKGAGGAEVFDMRLRDLRARGGKLLDGDKLPALPAGEDIPGCRLTQAPHGDERRQQLAVLDEEFRRVGLGQADGGKGEAPQVKFIADLQSRQKVVVLGGGVGICFDGLDRIDDRAPCPGS